MGLLWSVVDRWIKISDDSLILIVRDGVWSGLWSNLGQTQIFHRENWMTTDWAKWTSLELKFRVQKPSLGSIRLGPFYQAGLGT